MYGAKVALDVNIIHTCALNRAIICLCVSNYHILRQHDFVVILLALLYYLCCISPVRATDFSQASSYSSF